MDMAITMVAVSRGWIGQEPVTLPRWDLRVAEDRSKAYQYLVKEKPDLLVIAWPCTVWSPLQFLGPMDEERHKRLIARQQEERDSFLTLVHDTTKFQRLQGRAHLGENPFSSRAWKEPLIQATYEGEPYGRVDMCRYGLRRPDTKELLKKPTKIAGTKEIVRRCEARCTCKETHAHTLGSFRWKGKTRSVAEFAGGYTRAFALKVVRGAEVFLKNWTEEECTTYAAEDVGLQEEAFTTPEDGVPPVVDDAMGAGDDDDVPIEVDPNPPVEDPEIVDTVARVHQRLGHPTKQALVRMLKLSGAPKKTLDCAKNYQCPVCESKAPPDKPYLQKPRERLVSMLRRTWT